MHNQKVHNQSAQRKGRPKGRPRRKCRLNALLLGRIVGLLRFLALLAHLVLGHIALAHAVAAWRCRLVLCECRGRGEKGEGSGGDDEFPHASNLRVACRRTITILSDPAFHCRNQLFVRERAILLSLLSERRAGTMAAVRPSKEARHNQISGTREDRSEGIKPQRIIGARTWALVCDVARRSRALASAGADIKGRARIKRATRCLVGMPLQR